MNKPTKPTKLQYVFYFCRLFFVLFLLLGLCISVWSFFYGLSNGIHGMSKSSAEGIVVYLCCLFGVKVLNDLWVWASN